MSDEVDGCDDQDCDENIVGENIDMEVNLVQKTRLDMDRYKHFMETMYNCIDETGRDL